jgi:hypothetical protein
MTISPDLMRSRDWINRWLLQFLVPLLLLVLTNSTNLNAQEAEADSAKNALIRELLEVTGAKADQAELSRTFTQQMVSVLQANNAVLSDEALKIIAEEVETVVAEQLHQEILQRKMYSIYARYFTIDEIQGLIDFNQSPVGQKANRVMPLLMRESMSAAQEWSEEIGPLLSKRVVERLDKADMGIKTNR